VDGTLTLRGRLIAGIVAGIVAALLVVLFAFVLQWDGSAPPASELFAFVAAALFGPSAYENAAAPLIGAAIIVLLAIAWALGYVYLVRMQPQLLARPWISGLAFGIIVFIFTQIALLTAGLYHRPSPGLLLIELVGHLVFYGVPVALVVAGFARRNT
jgi:hypothetical protein